MEYWIWNNVTRGWLSRPPDVYTSQLHMAGRFAESIAEGFVKEANAVLGDTDAPIEVMIPVHNGYLSAQAQRLVAEYVQTGDPGAFDRMFEPDPRRGYRLLPSRIMTWEEDLDVNELSKIVSEVSGGKVHIHYVDTGSDQNAIVVWPSKLTAEQAQQIFEEHYV